MHGTAVTVLIIVVVVGGVGVVVVVVGVVGVVEVVVVTGLCVAAAVLELWTTVLSCSSVDKKTADS